MNEPQGLCCYRVIQCAEPSRTLTATHPDIKVLFTSGYTGDYLSHLNILTTGAEFLAKPYMPDALAVKVREVLDQRAV